MPILPTHRTNFQDPSISEQLPEDPTSIVSSLVVTLQRQHGRTYPWAVGNGRQLPSGYILAKRKKDFRSGRPIISFVDSPFRPMLNILARLIFQLIPVACPNHFASGDVYTLLSILKPAPVDADLILVNQELAGFFTSIDQDRFVGAWFMLLDFLRPHMDVSDNEAFSVYPGKTNNPGDIIKGRTFRRLNATRKITIKDVPDLIRSALNMQTFALGQKCIRQCRGSTMGSPLSPALCLMVVSISEQIWSINFKQILSNHNLFIRHIRYVDNRLIFGDARRKDLPPYEVLLDDGFYGKPIIPETEPDQEFLGFMLETKPLELIYQGPTNVSQVLSPFSTSPPKVLLSGFQSRCHIVIVKGAFPEFRVRQGLDQLINLHTLAGFPKGELHNISTQIMIQHQNLQSHEQKFCRLLRVPILADILLHCWFVVLFSPLLVRTPLFQISLLFLFISLAQTRFPLSAPFLLQRSWTMLTFHHHLARAIMHLNYLTGLLPFSEPSIEWDDPIPDHHLRSGRSNPASRSLHTFVPLPASSNPPTMVSHGGIPSHMVLNPEPNLRPLTIASHPREEEGHNPSLDVTTRTPVPSGGHTSTTSLDTPKWNTPAPVFPRATTRTTTPVPVRSKQRSTPIEAPTTQEETAINFWPRLHVTSSTSAHHFRDPTSWFQFG